jgi:peptide/nickel transport system substrate-binding protein
VVFTLDRARTPANSRQLSGLLRHITSVEASGDHRVIIHFDQPYPEQFYDATFHVPPLPAHLVESIAPEALGKSPFAANPVGNGPYKWVRRIPEQQAIELAADSTFFLGRPGIARVLFQAVSNADARGNMLLIGAADAIDNAYQVSDRAALLALPDYQSVPFPTFTVGYLLFNTRDPADTTRPHPILGDVEVRRALTEALDRDALARTGYGPSGVAPPGPVSQASWVFDRKLARFPYDTAAARRRLAAAGWIDHDGDGILDNYGTPLRISLILSNTSLPRRQIATAAQESLRLIGVDLQLLVLSPPEIGPRVLAGNFDMVFNLAVQDPTPSGLTQSWSCAGGTNFARYCDPEVDSLYSAAIASMKPGPIWRQALSKIAEDAPAIWVYTLTFVALVHRRFDHVTIRPQSTWIDLWRWRLRAGAELPRDLPPKP